MDLPNAHEKEEGEIQIRKNVNILQFRKSF